MGKENTSGSQSSDVPLPVPVYIAEKHVKDSTQSHVSSCWVPWILAMALLLSGLAILSGLAPGYASDLESYLPSSSHSWGAYTPWYPAGNYTAPPDKCNTTQVNVIQRHGARFPTSGATKRIQTALDKLQSVKSFNDSSLDFLTEFTYDLGQDDLVAFGATQSKEAGEQSYERYSALVGAENLPFVRASGSTRVVDTAHNWTAGFASASQNAFVPVLSVIIDESANDTLDDSMCPNAGDSDDQLSQWLSVFAPSITKRLNAGAPGASLTDTDTYNLMSLCPFETLAKESKSRFCDLFTDEDFEGFEYSMDLDKYYGTGYGQELGPVQGVGYVNELLARLMGKAVQDHTQTNSTLDDSSETFPLNRTFYVDFSHDNQMIAIFSAMGLFNQSSPLDPQTQSANSSTWVASKLTPFSARMVIERLSCWEEEYVRIFVNDQLQPLEFCGGDEDRLCTLDAFVQSQAYAKNDGDGDFERCFSS